MTAFPPRAQGKKITLELKPDECLLTIKWKQIIKQK
jgi:hypothetical protein